MFFTQFSQMMSPEVDYNLTISRTAAGELVVIVLPRVRDLKDAAQHRIAPLRLIGSAEVLDREFFASIAAPIQKTSGLLVNMAEYEHQQEAAAKESKAAKDQQDKLSKEEREKKAKYDGFIRKSDELEAAGNLEGALLQVQQARLHATEKALKGVDDRIAALKNKIGQGSLFDAPPAPQPERQPCCRDHEYDGYEDFPSEMIAPTYQAAVNM